MQVSGACCQPLLSTRWQQLPRRLVPAGMKNGGIASASAGSSPRVLGTPLIRHAFIARLYPFKEHVVPVMLPDPARFALHKLIVSTLRDPSWALSADKDRWQAAVLIDALSEKFPDWLTTAATELEKSVLPRVGLAAVQTLKLAPDLPERARDFLADLCAQT